MKLITLYLPESYIKLLDQLVDAKLYPNRAEAIRVSIHDLLMSESKVAQQLIAETAAKFNVENENQPFEEGFHERRSPTVTNPERGSTQ